MCIECDLYYLLIKIDEKKVLLKVVQFGSGLDIYVFRNTGDTMDKKLHYLNDLKFWDR